jgi:hypothetical protein
MRSKIEKFVKSTKIKSLQRATKPLEASNWNFLRALCHGALPQMLRVKSNQFLDETSLSNEMRLSVALQINSRCKFRNLTI